MPPQPLVHRRLPIRSLRAERLVVCRTCPVTLFLAPPLLQIKPVEIVNAHRSTATGVAQLLVRATYDPRRETQREPVEKSCRSPRPARGEGAHRTQSPLGRLFA